MFIMMTINLVIEIIYKIIASIYLHVTSWYKEKQSKKMMDYYYLRDLEYNHILNLTKMMYNYPKNSVIISKNVKKMINEQKFGKETSESFLEQYFYIKQQALQFYNTNSMYFNFESKMWVNEEKFTIFVGERE